MLRDDATLLDLLGAARLAVSFVADMDKATFDSDVKTQSAVRHQILLLGEGVKRLSEAFRNRHAKIPWKEIAGMRDKLIHEYDLVDLDEVWKTVSGDIPKLLTTLQTLAPREGPS